ncbi:MAG: tetratricopeptide repeat protein [Bacteroidetes bacterium]|nr:tetratricopeptide repeat protein [Bacteroidota bacterium]
MAKFLKLLIIVLCSCLALESFECASPEFTSAKVSYNQKDYLKARDMLEKEVHKNPNNVEGWFLLANTKRQLLDYKGATEAIMIAQNKAPVGDLKNKIAAESYIIWVEVYNIGVNLYNQFQTTRGMDTKKLKENLKLGLELKPENLELLALAGSVAEIEGDTASAIKEYNNYIHQCEPLFELAKSKGLAIGMPRWSAIQALGRTDTTSITDLQNGDSLFVDRLRSGGNDVYLYSAKKKDATVASVEGWRINLPKTWIHQERERYFNYNVRPYAALALMYYRQKEYSKAVEAIDKASILTPEDEQNSTFKVQIYEEQGKTAEVLTSLEELSKRNPTNKSYLSQLAFVYSRLQRNDDAIEAYEKSLKIDPTYDLALFNLAAAYKNKASEFQKEETKKKDANPKYKDDETKYFPLLTKAAEYFERYKQLPQKTGDITTLQQLANIYEVTRDKQKLESIISELESLESSYNTNADYYEFLGGLYARQTSLKKGMAEKSKLMFDKADKLRKK